MVSSEQRERDGVGELEQQQGEYGLEGEGAAVHEVAVEEVAVAVAGHAVQLEDVAQVVELAVCVSADGERACDSDGGGGTHAWGAALGCGGQEEP